MLTKRLGNNTDRISSGGSTLTGAIFKLLHLLLFTLFSTIAFAAPDTDPKKLEYKVKAAYLYNFTKFVKWPDEAFDPSPDSPLNICILGTVVCSAQDVLLPVFYRQGIWDERLTSIPIYLSSTLMHVVNFIRNYSRTHLG